MLERALAEFVVWMSYARAHMDEAQETAPDATDARVLQDDLRLSGRSSIATAAGLATDVPRWGLVRSVGRGSQGVVLEVRDRDLGRSVAVKCVRLEDASDKIRFAREVRTMGQLEHPNILPIHDAGIDDSGQGFVVQRFLDGQTLEHVLERLVQGDRAYHARFGFERRVALFLSLLRAVAFAHAKGIVHRDIKPANVLVGLHGEVFLIDWGVAAPAGEVSSARDVDAYATTERGERVLDDPASLRCTMRGALVGTPAYMSPEQAQGLPADERSDVYALCVVLHELLGLRHYLDDLRSLHTVLAAVITRTAPSPSDLSSPHQPRVPMDLAWFVERGLRKDPAQRYPSVLAMIERLEARAAGKIPVQCPNTLLKRSGLEILGLFDRYPPLATVLLVSLVAGVLLHIFR